MKKATYPSLEGNGKSSLVETPATPPVKIRQWQVDGHQRTPCRFDNGIILFASRRWPLMIDPQRSSEQNGLKILKPKKDLKLSN